MPSIRPLRSRQWFSTAVRGSWRSGQYLYSARQWRRQLRPQISPSNLISPRAVQPLLGLDRDGKQDVAILRFFGVNPYASVAAAFFATAMAMVPSSAPITVADRTIVSSADLDRDGLADSVTVLLALCARSGSQLRRVQTLGNPQWRWRICIANDDYNVHPITVL